MENKEFIAELSKRIGRPESDVIALVEGFANILKEKCGALESVAIPGFGKFSGEKIMERVETDLDTGKKTLFPQPFQELQVDLTEQASPGNPPKRSFAVALQEE